MNEETIVTESPLTLDLGLCKACGICIALCPTHVFDATDLGEPVVARPDECTACLLCELHCPDFAIEVRRREKKRGPDDVVAAPEEPEDADAGRVFAAVAGRPDNVERPVSGSECGVHGGDD